jgi:hypothetical protein
VRAVLLALVGMKLLAGCTSDPRYQQGLQWAIEAEEERARLDKMGFPQYGGAM